MMGKLSLEKQMTFPDPTPGLLAAGVVASVPTLWGSWEDRSCGKSLRSYKVRTTLASELAELGSPAMFRQQDDLDDVSNCFDTVANIQNQGILTLAC